MQGLTNRELAQALRSAASALEHGRYQTVRRKLALFEHAWFTPVATKSEPITLLSMPDSAIEFFDSAVSAAESNLDNLLDEHTVEQIVSYFELQVKIHMRHELTGAKKYGNDSAAYRDAVRNGAEPAF